MRQLQPVLWTKGLLITPQHLQTQDRFLEDLLGFRLGSHAFCPWGFRRLEVDREAMAGGAFALTSAAGLFPDGLLFDVPDADPPPDPKPLEDYWREDAETLDLHLAIPERRPGGHNVSVDAGNGSTRYRVEAVLRRDENTGAAERPIQVGRKNLRILAGTERLEGHSLLPVARVRRGGTGQYELDARFVPPAVDIEASPYLMSIARRLVELLSAKSATLSGMRRERRRGLAHFGVSDVANFWLLYTVNSYLPEVRHLFETRKGHPAGLYRTMLELAGALTTFSTERRPGDLPPYDQGDLSGCFTELDEAIRELLETVVPPNHVTLPLHEEAETGPQDRGVHVTALEKDSYLSAPEMYLAVRSDLEADRLIRQVPKLVKVTSRDRMDVLINQALPGIDLRHAPDPPTALPVKLDYHYFRLDRSGPEWDAIRRARNLAAYVPVDFPSPRLELVILLPKER